MSATAIWYLGSPYSHEDIRVVQERYRWACEAAARLFERSVLVYSPIAHSHAVNRMGGLGAQTFQFWQEFDLGMIDRLSGLLVLMLPGWNRSVGLTAEINHARNTGRTVLYIEPLFNGSNVSGYVMHESEPAGARL
jgi:hypothetical protein